MVQKDYLCEMWTLVGVSKSSDFEEEMEHYLAMNLTHDNLLTTSQNLF